MDLHGLSAYWKLAPGRVHSLRARRDTVLRITQGRAWATLDEIGQADGNEAGDFFLAPGQQLAVPAGRHLVLESMDERPVHFEWLASTAAPGVLVSVAELGLAARLAVGALARLLAASAAGLYAHRLRFRRR